MDEQVRQLAELQEDVLSREQLAVAGVNRWHIRDQVRARRWRLVGRAVVLHRGPLTRRQRIWIAVIHAGPEAAVCAWTALELAGVETLATPAIHVVVRRGQRIHRLPDMVLHESRRFDWASDTLTNGIPRTSTARAVVDAAAWSQNPRTATRVLLTAVHRRAVTPQLVLDALDHAGRIRHRRLLRAVALDAQGGVHALTELDLTRLMRRAGMPEPVRQRIRTDSGGRRRYLDMEFVRGDGRTVVLEVDGGVHIEASNWWDDQVRQTDLVVQHDALWLRVPGPIVRIDPDGVVRQLARALHLPEPRPVRRPVRRSARSA